MPTERDDQPGRDLAGVIEKVLRDVAPGEFTDENRRDFADYIVRAIADPANLDAVMEAAGMERIGAEYPWEALWDASIPERRSYYTRKADQWYARKADR